MDVWAFWHPNEDERNIKKPEYYIRDIQGKVLVPYADIMSPEFNKLARSMIDELAGRYNKYGNLKGIFLDEFWHGLGRDPLVNYLDRYVQYCKGNYNETPPENIYGLIAGGRNWHDPDNIWWRRYILWKNTLIVDWVRNITDYANSKGLLIMNQPVFTAEFSDGWNWGHGDMYNLAREGNLLWAYETRNSKLLNHYPKERIVLGTHTHNRWNRQSISLITGKGGSQFVFGAMWIPIAQAMNPEILNLVARQIRSNREWYGAEHLSGTAILNNGLILELKTQNPKTVFTRTHLSLQKKLQASFDTGMLLIDNIEFYDRYKVLIAPPHTVSCLPMRTVNGLKKYVENGGIIISLNSRFSSARADLTDEKDLTPEFTGIEYEDKKSMDIVETVRFTDGGYQDIKLNTFLTTRARIVNPEVKIRAVFAETDEPAITELNIGKGKIIAYHYDAIDAVSMSESDTLDYLLTQIERYSAPGVRVEGDLQIHYTLKKNNWVVTTLLGNEEKGYPMSGNLYIDTERLGLDFKNNKYKVYSLSRDRELQPQGIHWTLWGRHWTSEMLKEGIDIYIPPNSLVDLKLPSGPDDVYAADRYVQSAVLPRWYTRNYTRSYEYEIIAIAPVGESYPGEDKHETDGN